MKKRLVIAGILMGGVVGFLLRPSVPLMGQLPFTTIITHRLRELMAGPEAITICTIVLFELLRGPRLQQEEIEAQEALFPRIKAVPFGSFEAEQAAELYKKISRPRGREADLAIAACALTHRAHLWIGQIRFQGHSRFSAPRLSLTHS